MKGGRSSADPDVQNDVMKNEFGQPLFSHSSPVYVEVAGRPIFDPEASRDLLAEVERAMRQVAETARFGDDVERGSSARRLSGGDFRVNADSKGLRAAADGNEETSA